MPTSHFGEVIQRLRSAALMPDGAGLTDGQLLEDYLSRREEATLTALVRRHSPMVWGVCRRVLHNYHDAEDAFQATFLVLVRKAASIASPELLANWLYGVAHQTALKARGTAAKRRTREKQVMKMREPSAVEPDIRNDLPLLDQELSRLPDKYRIVIVLCDLESKTRKEAAEQLGVPEGTVAGRLARARGMLAKRLSRQGVVLSSGTLAAMLSQSLALACVPTSLLASTIKAATLLAMGKAAASALISVQVTALMEGVMKTMFLTKIKSTAVVVLAMALSGVGVATLAVGGARQRETASAAKTQDEKPVANAPKNNPAKEDEEKLQGVWDVVSVVHDGKPVEKKFFDGQVWVFEGDTLRGVSRATYKLDPSQMPKAIDLIRKSPRSNEAEKVVTLHGIYELKGDDLKIALPPDGGERPKNFDSTAENHTAVNVLKRAHGAKKQAPKDEDSGI